MSETKTYKVLKRLGWGGGTYMPNDVVEMPEAWGNYYVKEKVLEEMTESVITGETNSEETTSEEAERSSKTAIEEVDPTVDEEES